MSTLPPSSASLEEEWTTATALADKHSRTLLSIDCSEHPTHCEIQPSMTFPSIFLLQANKPPVKYLGPLLSKSLNNFLSRSTRLQPTLLTQVDDLAKFKTSDETVFILFLPRPQEFVTSVYEDLAQKYKNEFTFGTVVGVDELLEKERVDLELDGVLVVYKPLDGETEKLDLTTANSGVDEVEKFIKESSRLTITDLSPWNHPRLLELQKPLVYLFAPTPSARDNLRSQYLRFAKDYYQQFVSILVDPHLFPDLMPQLGLLDTTRFPAGAVRLVAEDKTYPYPQTEEMTLGKVQGWGMRIWQGGVEAWVPGGGEKKGGDSGKKEGGGDSGIRIQGKVGTKRKVTVGGGGWGKGKGKIPTIPGVRINIPGVRRDEL
ncbi:uncharacterized protein QC763_705365 [Podospora pseudopauciseta]|uniref:Uncharacterized protein n=1 Tax=Podospora pseudopauciseta TaxID=2093780 RepID=A0ABR0H0Y4_9PEZI|nr:hypothetical protein QC763_705365 [Podospora pseudopauciseta]